MKGKSFLTLASLIFVLAWLMIGFIPVSYAQEKTFHLKYSASMLPVTHEITRVPAIDWGKELEKRSAGRIKVTVFADGSLTPPTQAYDGVVKGISEVACSAFTYTPGRFPVMTALDLPNGLISGVVATKTINEFYRRLKPKELDDTHPLFFFAHGPGVLHTVKKPVHKLEDVTGLKLRSTGAVQMIARALGASPVAMTFGETYDALAKGIVDGALFNMNSLEKAKLAEILKFTTLNYSSSYNSGFWVVMNIKTWNSLPVDLQKIVTEVSEMYTDLTAKVFDMIDQSGYDFSLKLGHEFIKLSEAESARWKKAVEPVFDDYIKRSNEKGLDGKMIVKVLRELCEKYNR